MAEDDAEMTTARIYVDEKGWRMESGAYTLEVGKENLAANLRIDDSYACDIPYAPEFFKAMKAMEQAFRERYEGGDV